MKQVEGKKKKKKEKGKKGALSKKVRGFQYILLLLKYFKLDYSNKIRRACNQ